MVELSLMLNPEQILNHPLIISVGFKIYNLRIMSREPMATAHETLSNGSRSVFSLVRDPRCDMFTDPPR